MAISSPPSDLTEPIAGAEEMTAEELILAAHARFGKRLCLTCSWQKQSSALVHLVSELGIGIDVIELDTHLFFRESYETRDRLVERYGLTLIRPEVPTVADQHREEGPNLWERDPDRCCHVRKVEPLSAPCSRTTPGSPGSGATSRRAGATRRRWCGPSATASGSSTRSPTGTRSGSGHTSSPTRSPTTRCTTPGTVRSAASRALGRRRRRGGTSRPLGRVGQARVRYPSR